MTPRIFCSDLSRNRGEQVFGTAPRAETWLLIEHPGAWSPKGFPDDRLSLPIRRYIEALARGLGGAKKLMIRHRRRGEALRMFVVRSSEEHPSTSALAFGAYEDLIELSPEDLLTQAKPYARPLFLVCTHGKHDKCCAKFGFAVYCALHEAMPEDAWECSHVGGDRFAANVVCFPEGIYFGHVSPAASLAAVAEYLLGRIVLESYRGRCCYSLAGSNCRVRNSPGNGSAWHRRSAAVERRRVIAGRLARCVRGAGCRENPRSRFPIAKIERQASPDLQRRGTGIGVAVRSHSIRSERVTLGQGVACSYKMPVRGWNVLLRASTYDGRRCTRKTFTWFFPCLRFGRWYSPSRMQDVIITYSRTPAARRYRSDREARRELQEKAGSCKDRVRRGSGDFTRSHRSFS